MDLVEVDDVGLEPLEARLAGIDEMVARQAAVIRAIAHRKPRLGGDEYVALALAAERLADDLLRGAARIDIGGVDQVDAGVEAEVDLAARLGEADIADLGEGALAAHRHGAHGEHRHFEAGPAEQAVFHDFPRCNLMRRDWLDEEGGPLKAAVLGLAQGAGQGADGHL